MLVERHSHKMFRLAYRMTGNEADGEVGLAGGAVPPGQLCEIYEHEGDRELRANAIRYLAMSDSVEAKRFLVEFLSE